MAYYYLMAQLPYLLYEQKPPMASAAFKTMAQYQLDEADAAFMDKLTLSPDFSDKKSGCGFIDKWQEWERSLRVNLARQRAVKLKKENLQLPPASVFPLDASNAATKAADEQSPLDGEILLDKARWHAIDEMTGGSPFSRESAYAYYLKLLLLERRQSFELEKGFAEYKSLYASIIEDGQGGVQESQGEHT